MRKSVVVSDGTFECNTAPIQGDFEYVSRLAADTGFEALQMTVLDPAKIDIKDTKDILDKYGLKVSSIATGTSYSIDGLSIGSGDELIRLRAVNRMKEYIDVATQLDKAFVIIGAIRGLTTDANSKEQFQKQLNRSIGQILDYASKKDITIIFEHMNKSIADTYLTVNDVADYIRKFSSPHLKLQLDSFHLNLEGEDVYSAIVNNDDILAQFDISDNNRMAPDGNHYDFRPIIMALREINYDKYLVFEYRSSPPSKSALEGLKYIQGLINN